MDVTSSHAVKPLPRTHLDTNAAEEAAVQNGNVIGSMTHAVTHTHLRKFGQDTKQLRKTTVEGNVMALQ